MKSIGLKTQDLLSKSGLDSFFLDYLNFKLDGFTKESDAYADFKQIFTQGNYTNETMLKEILHYAEQYHTFYHGNKNLNDTINIALPGLRQLKQTTVYLFLFQIFDDFEEGLLDQDDLGAVFCNCS